MPVSRIRYVEPGSDAESRELLRSIKVDPSGIEAMFPKMRHVNIRIGQVPCGAANILKQEMLSIGGDAAVARGTVGCTVPETDVLVMGTRKQLNRLVDKLNGQSFGVLRKLAGDVALLLAGLDREGYILRTCRREMALGKRTLVMGILNVTPDSFSDGGRYMDPEKAVEHAHAMIEAGADILDIGGESTRPGSDAVSEEEELRRVCPIVERLAAVFDVPVSVDTMKAAVAQAAVDAGAEIVNDVSAMLYDERMADVVARTRAAVVLMHMRGTPKDMQQGDLAYGDVIAEILDFLRDRLDVAALAGISSDCIAVDPGIGFGKTVQDNLKILKHLREFKVLGRPILMGVSRKAFIGSITADAAPMRQAGTAAAVAAAVLNGSSIVRVHDVGEMKKVAAVCDAIRGAET